MASTHQLNTSGWGESYVAWCSCGNWKKHALEAHEIQPLFLKHINCNHKYKCTYENYDKESYECERCGDRYNLYYDEMQ